MFAELSEGFIGSTGDVRAVDVLFAFVDGVPEADWDDAELVFLRLK